MLQLRTAKGETLAELDRQRTAIGRDPANDVVLEDGSVSGFHAVVFKDQGAVSVVDLGSTNGTALDGVRLRERTALKAWSRLRLGGVELVVADTESREPTRVQPAVPVRGRVDGARPTRVRPAAGEESRAAPAQPAGDIRFESLQQEPAGPEPGASAPPAAGRAAGSVASPRHTSAPPAVDRTAALDAGPRDASAPPAAGRTAVLDAGASVPPAADATAVPGASPRIQAGGPHALFGGYPRGLAWLLFSFRGRVRRSLFWKCWAVSIPVTLIPQLATPIALSLAGFDPYSYAISSTFYVLVFTWPLLAVVAKRIHDSGRGSLPWCTLLALANVLAIVLNWMMANRISQGGMLIPSGLFLLVMIPLTYVFYLVVVKRGDDGDNDFGDQNPHQGIVFGAQGEVQAWGTR